MAESDALLEARIQHRAECEAAALADDADAAGNERRELERGGRRRGHAIHGVEEADAVGAEDADAGALRELGELALAFDAGRVPDSRTPRS